jgi:hypothetical protein
LLVQIGQLAKKEKNINYLVELLKKVNSKNLEEIISTLQEIKSHSNNETQIKKLDQLTGRSYWLLAKKSC